ncbi:MAG TPA: DUF58 domain-containing protein [Candidatus Eisenbacteria bacterium]
MITPELLAQVRRLTIRSRRAVEEVFAGSYRSAFRGRGLEFAEVREYVPGDDIRTIDWNVTARAGRPFVKRHEEERELTVLIALDCSASLSFGSRGRSKRETAAEAGALLALAASRSRDRVGLLLFTDRIELYLPPSKVRARVLRVVRELLAFEPQGRGTDVGGALSFLGRVLRRHAVVFLISDWISSPFERELAFLGRRHELTVIQVRDPLETDWPSAGLLSVRDLETGRERVISLGSAAARKAFRAARSRQARAAGEAFRLGRAARIELRSDAPVAPVLVRHMEQRARPR